MARRHGGLIGGTFVFDCEALSQLLAQDVKASQRVDFARNIGASVVVCAMTIPEAQNAKVRRERPGFVLSRLTVEPVTEEIARSAADLLEDCGLHGHKYAIDAVVAAVAKKSPRPVVLYTSDRDDMERLCAEPDRPREDRIRIVQV